MQKRLHAIADSTDSVLGGAVEQGNHDVEYNMRFWGDRKGLTTDWRSPSSASLHQRGRLVASTGCWVYGCYRWSDFQFFWTASIDQGKFFLLDGEFLDRFTNLVD